MPEDEAADALNSPATGHGRWWIAAAAVLWSSSGLFVKSTMFLDWPDDVRGIRLAFWRALFAGLLLIPAVRKPRLRWLMAPMVLCFAGMNMTYLSAMTLGTAANAIWLQNTAPLWVMLFGVLVLKEPFTRRQAISSVLLVIGLLIILIPGLQGERPIGVALGLIAGGFYAAVVLLLRAMRDEDGAWLVVLNHLGAAVLIAPFMFAGGLVWPTAPQFGTLVLFGFFQMGLAYYCFSRGLRSVSGGDAALIALIEPLLVPVWAFAVARELPSGTTALGAGAILLGLVYQVAAAQFHRRAGRIPSSDAG
jgi:DME family drug/metabolite transporter